MKARSYITEHERHGKKSVAKTKTHEKNGDVLPTNVQGRGLDPGRRRRRRKKSKESGSIEDD